MAAQNHTLTAPEIQHHRQALAGARYLLARLVAVPDCDLQPILRAVAARSAAALA